MEKVHAQYNQQRREDKATKSDNLRIDSNHGISCSRRAGWGEQEDDMLTKIEVLKTLGHNRLSICAEVR
jgi:hypothetical protein